MDSQICLFQSDGGKGISGIWMRGGYVVKDSRLLFLYCLHLTKAVCETVCEAVCDNIVTDANFSQEGRK